MLKLCVCVQGGGDARGMVGVRSSALWTSLKPTCGLAPWTGTGLGAWEWQLGRWGKEASPTSVGRCLAGISRARFQLPLPFTEKAWSPGPWRISTDSGGQGIEHSLACRHVIWIELSTSGRARSPFC